MSVDSRSEEQGRSWSSRPMLGVLDQALISGAHFAVGLSVARGGSEVALGTFGLAFLILNTGGDLHRAILWLPMSQEAVPDHYRAARRLAFALGGCLAIAAGVASAALWFAERGTLAIVMGLVAVVIPMQFTHEIQRRVQLARLAPDRALLGDLGYGIGAALALVLIPGFGPAGSELVVRALVALIVASAVGTAVGASLLHGLPVGGDSVRSLAKRYAPAGRAYLLNALMVIVSQRFSMLVVASVLGLAALGSVEAARLLTAPLMVVVLGLAAVVVPDVAHDFRAGRFDRAKKAIARTSVMAGVAVGSYTVVMAVGFEWVSNLAFGKVFDRSLAMTVLLSGSAGAALVVTALIVPLGAAGVAHLVPRARLPGTLLVVALSIPVALVLDERWVLGLVLTEGILSVALLVRVLRRSK